MQIRHFGGLLVAASLVSGCATWNKGAGDDAAAMEAERQQAALEAENQRLRTELSRRETASPVAKPAPAPDSNTQGLPLNAKAGECYARVAIPPKFKTVTERELLSAATEKLEIIPAKYEWVDERVLIKPAHEKVVEVIPAQYRWVEEKVLVKPAAEKVIEVPAEYKWLEEKILVRPASQVWKPGRGAVEKVDNQTGEIMCLVEVPAEYKVIKKKVVAQAAATRKEIIPAEYKTVKRQELVKEPELKKVSVPAQYDTVRVQKLVTPAREIRTPIAAKYQEVERTVKVADGAMQWRSVLCEVNATPEVIRRIQQALKDAGYNPGKIDGVLGPATLRAMNAYQVDNKLAQGGITLDAVRRLGVQGV